jgi:hypothetical protein
MAINATVVYEIGAIRIAGIVATVMLIGSLGARWYVKARG